ncbi:MAG: hypothetical protein HY931_03220 [Candidatus Falkowbacteria bacterium]|nr:MAG: hypothetical protein HY931_03220 [Candidatus Falkowbacteria bacterium]
MNNEDIKLNKDYVWDIEKIKTFAKKVYAQELELDKEKHDFCVSKYVDSKQ